MYLDFYLFIFIFFSTPQIENILSDLWINCISHECILFFIDGIFIFLSSSLKGTLKSLRRESLEQKCRKWRLEFLSLIFMNHWSTFLTVLILFQALILKELDLVDPEYIGTICGSYRRGDWSFWSTYLTSVII